jgi:hypothetical protein
MTFHVIGVIVKLAAANTVVCGGNSSAAPLISINRQRDTRPQPVW